MSHTTVVEMVLLTAGGWMLSIQDIEVLARIISLLTPAVLSILIYIRNKKNKDK